MKAILTAALVATAVLAATPVLASAGLDLAKKSNCLACHAVATKVVGPSYLEVAKKYASDKTAEAKLIDKVKKGGSGAWGTMPMPANAQVKDADIKTLVQWILAGAK